MKISIIVPFYNAAAFMRPCIGSILSQTFSGFELVCVDDCSTDGTYGILEEYAASDSRVKVFRTEKNSGSARKPVDIGINAAKGDFCCIVGHDDALEETYLEKTVKRQKETGADIVMGRMVFFDENGRQGSIPDDSFDFSRILSGRQAVMLTVGGWKIGANGAVIERNLLKAQRLGSKIDPALMNADEYDTRELLINAGKTAFCDATYLYRQHPGSVTKQTARKFECLETDRYLTGLFLDRFGEDSDEYRTMLNEYVRSIIGYAKLYKKAGMQAQSDKAKALKIIRDNYISAGFRKARKSDLKLRRKLKFLLPFPLFMKSV